MLSGLRVLDLTDQRGALAGRLFAELGADVIKVEPPAGCDSRREGPFLDGLPGPDRSLYFIAYQAGKRSVTLNLDVADGQLLLADLVRRSDFVVESLGPDYLDSRAIGYEWMSELNPRLIYTTITPFGDRGPSSGWRALDINCWAAGGMMFLTGLPGRPPLQMAVPQAYLHAGAEAATASMLAYFSRLHDDRGQKVVVDTQACVVWTLMNEQAYPVLHGEFLRRTGPLVGSAEIARRTVYPCADGYVTFILTGGSPYANSSRLMVDWMVEEGAAPDWLKDVDFDEWTLARFMADRDPAFLELVRRGEEAVQDFFSGKTKMELYLGAIERRILLAPVSTPRDIAEDRQLAARDYFRTVRHESVGKDLRMPGPFARFSAVSNRPLSPAPQLGQHNVDVYRDLLGVNMERMRYLYSTGVI
jgi:crotonobetainyl-CoA:carnitine CoA-transferase CaiB-like acyl-CoA transferase